MFKKTLLSSAIVAAMGISSFAQAAVTLDSDATDALIYASQIAVDGTTGTSLANAAGNQDLSAPLGFSVTAGSTRFIRIDLGSGAEFDGAPTITNSGVTFVTPTIAAGGDGESFVIFEVAAGAGGNSPADVVTVTPAATGIKVFGTGAVSATYNLYETGTAAANNGTALSTASDTAYTFGTALAVSAGDAGESQISVATNSTEFTAGLTSPIANVSIGLAAPAVLWTDGLATAMADLVTAATDLVVTGDFSAALDANGDLDPTKVVSTALGVANALTATTATWDIGVGVLAGDIINYTVDGETEIVPTAYTGLYDVTAPATATTGDANIGELSELEKDGATTSASMVLTPSDEGGAFRNFVRITNTSSVSGDVFVRLWNDLGDTVAFGLADVAGQASVLGAQESTSLINVDALFDAAVAADSTFAIGTDGRNKLRMSVEGNFPTISIDNVTVSRDNQSFSTFQ